MATGDSSSEVDLSKGARCERWTKQVLLNLLYASMVSGGSFLLLTVGSALDML